MNTKPVLTRLIAGALVATFTCAQADAATILVRCDKRVNRSSISVDGNNLVARFLRCRAQSGINLRTTRLKRTVGDELECDFDSNLNDIAAGATRIPANFIRGRQVTGKLINRFGRTVISDTSICRVR
ncbi:MAG: hypothetical protein ACR2KU_04050 [Gammaproteobacteria bacterium]